VNLKGEDKRAGKKDKSNRLGARARVWCRGNRELYTLRQVLARALEFRGLYSLGGELKRCPKG
jgi:hypothetical protein